MIDSWWEGNEWKDHGDKPELKEGEILCDNCGGKGIVYEEIPPPEEVMKQLRYRVSNLPDQYGICTNCVGDGKLPFTPKNQWDIEKGSLISSAGAGWVTGGGICTSWGIFHQKNWNGKFELAKPKNKSARA